MINEYSSPVNNTLEQYVPLPLQSMYQAAQAIQSRGDLAQAQNDQVQTGLSSAEALAPAHKDFINQFANDYRSQQGALLDKYHGNTSDPMYEQEARRLNMQFAADPRLQVIKSANEALKKKQSIKDELDAKGIKYIDSNPNFTGKDSQGNFLSNPGDLRATNFDQNINNAFKDKEHIMKSDGRHMSNIDALNTVRQSYYNQDGTLNTNSQDVQEGINYYKQQGLNDDQAIAKVKNHIDAGMGYLQQSNDPLYMEQQKLDWEKWKFNKEEEDKKKALLGTSTPPFQLLDYSKAITPTGKGSDGQDQSTPNSQLSLQVQKILDGLDDKGNLNHGSRFIEDTPENRAKFKDAVPVDYSSNKSGLSSLGIGSANTKLQVPGGYDENEVNTLATARKLLGYSPGHGTAKQVLTEYKNLISDFDRANYKVTSTDNKKLNDVMADVARRQISTGEVYKLTNGQLAKVTDPKELDEIQTSSSSDNTKDNEVKNIQIAGISPKTLGPLNGFTQFSNKGTNYYSPLPDQIQQKFTGSKSIENYIQDFDPKNLQEVKVNVGGKPQTILTNPNQEPIPYAIAGHVGRMIPFKQNQNGKLAGGGIFQEVDPKTGRDVGKPIPIPLSRIENEEKTSLFTEIVNNNKIKGD